MLFYLKKTLDLHCLEINDWTAWKCILKHALAMPLKGWMLNVGFTPVHIWLWQPWFSKMISTLFYVIDLPLRQVEICSGEENESCIGRQTGEETYSILCQMGYIPALQLCGVVQSRNNILVLNKFSIYLFSIYFLKPTPKHNLFFVTINMYMSVPTTFELHVIYHNNVNRKNRKQKKYY